MNAASWGASWDHYELLEPLDRSGMGEVYKARDRRLDRTVALKFIRGDAEKREVAAAVHEAHRLGVIHRDLKRKHRALVAVSGVSLASILVLSAWGVRSWLEAWHTQRQSEARARLAEDLGQQVKEIKWFLRMSYVLPLHSDAGNHEALAAVWMQHAIMER